MREAGWVVAAVQVAPLSAEVNTWAIGGRPNMVSTATMWLPSAATPYSVLAPGGWVVAGAHEAPRSGETNAVPGPTATKWSPLDVIPLRAGAPGGCVVAAVHVLP